jgi:hypothetical protein
MTFSDSSGTKEDSLLYNTIYTDPHIWNRLNLFFNLDEIDINGLHRVIVLHLGMYWIDFLIANDVLDKVRKWK